MSQKAELPSLTGHRTKTRKRDEKQVNNPTGFRDSVIEGLSKTGQEGSDITEIEVISIKQSIKICILWL